MLKTLPKIRLSLLLGAAFCATTFADRVVLTSGEKVEGKITKETEAEVTIESRAGGILDERTIKRAEIKSVEKDTPDEGPWQAIRNFKLGDNSMPAQQYDTYLGPIRTFLSQFPESKYKAEAEKLAADFEMEKKRVTAGERKLNGTWLNKEEVQRESYQINGAIALNFMKEQAARGDLVGALNTFDLLEKQYPGSKSYIDSVDQAKRLIPALKQQAEARLARLPAELADREKAVQLARVGEKAQIQNDIEREKKNDDAALAQSKQQNRKWPPLLPRNEEALQQIVKTANDEARRLTDIDLSQRRESLRLADQSKAALAKKDLTAAEEALNKARELWADNEVLSRVEKDLTAAKDAAASEPAVAVAEKPPEDDKPGEKTPEKPPTRTDGSDTPPTASATEEGEKSSNPLFRVVIALVIAGVAYAAWKAYSGARKKANDVIE